MKPSKLNGGRQALRATIVGIIVTLIAGYTAYVAFPYVAGPSLSVQEEQTSEGITRIYGITERVAYLTISGAQIPLEESGAFSIERAYPSGYTALQVSARDRFGRIITKTLTFIIPYAKKED